MKNSTEIYQGEKALVPPTLAFNSSDLQSLSIDG